MDPAVTLNNYLLLGAILFSLGMVGFLTRRNLIIMFLCAELMLQGVSMSLVAFSRFHGNWNGQILTIFSLALAGAEAAIALALVVALFRRHGTLDISLWQDLRESDQPAIPDEFGAEEIDEHLPELPHLNVAGRDPRKFAPADPLPSSGTSNTASDSRNLPAEVSRG